jgi:murein DD-endopeptidase MepM/ murein hydrolase activator NlpD
MKKRLLTILALAALLSAAALAAFTLPASAVKRTIYVKLPSGQVVPVTVDVPDGTPVGDVALPGVPVPPGTPSQPKQTSPETTPQKPPAAPKDPSAGGGEEQQGSKGKDKGVKKKKTKKKKKSRREQTGGADPQSQAETPRRRARRPQRSPMRAPDGSPTPQNPGFVDALPGPSTTTGVPNFVIRKFRVPIFLLPIYQAAGIQYGVRWEVLAAINEIETDYGRNLNVSSAGALGWMQFIPSSWRMYGVDANKDGKKDPYNPVDAIFAAGRYLKAAGAEKNLRRAIFAYNHANWYVDSVMLRAKLITGVPADLVGSLTGLTEGRFPVYARARYADDLAEREASKRVKKGQNAANVVQSKDDRGSIDVFARQGSPVVAVNDGVIKKIGKSKRRGRYMELQDVYGNTYTYSNLGSVSRFYPVPKDDIQAETKGASAKALKANDPKDPKPRAPASQGRQAEKARTRANDDPKPADIDDSKPVGGARNTGASVPVKQRLFAHPDMPGARENGGLEQLLDAEARRGGKGYEEYKNFARPFGLNSKDVRLKPLRKGARVIGGTLLGRVGKADNGKGSHLNFQIRPAGKGAPRIDPKPILDGWKLLEATAVYRASGRNALYGDDAGRYSIGQILLLPKPLLEKRVLSDNRIDVYPCGRKDIRSGQIDRRVLASMAYLAESGLRPTVTSLKCGHGFYTSSGNVSHHSSGNAADIAKINGVPILGHQERGGVTETAVRRLMRLQGTMRADQIISLLELGGNTVSMRDHADHIHLGFRPLFGDNRKAGRQALEVLKPGQWSDLLSRLRKIENPVVPTSPSKYSIPVPRSKRSSSAHRGE